MSFDSVRVHADDEQADDVGALAFAQGDDIHLSPSAPDPESADGMALLGHELTHVVQQRQGAAADAEPQAKAADGVAPQLADPSLEAEADAVGAKVAAGESVAGTIVGSAGGGVAQHFGAKEHKDAGDAGSGGKTYSWVNKAGKPGGAYPFTLTHGDIVMLSGDLFDPRDERPKKGGGTEKVKDNLFAIAGRSSAHAGQKLETQDEIIAAMYNKRRSDPRFDEGGEWHWAIDVKDSRHWFQLMNQYQQGRWARTKGLPEDGLSKDVKKAVSLRYDRLAEFNSEHFVDPKGIGTGPGTGGDRGSAGGSYRAMHEAAISSAYQAGLEGKDINVAMVREAAAEHFLTDGFAAGHLRTPRTSIMAHWDAVYPDFHDNFMNYLVHRVADGLNDMTTNVATVLKSKAALRAGVRKTLGESLAGKPRASIGAIVSLLAHDVDNETGVDVVNAIGLKWRTYGDSHMREHDAKHPNNLTYPMVTLAVQLGVADITAAYALGETNRRSPANLTDEQVRAQVRSRTGAPARPRDDLYGAEQMMPTLDPAAANDQQVWQVGSLDELWDKPVRTGFADRLWGLEIVKEVNTGTIGEELNAIHQSQPETKGPADDWINIPGIRVYPRRAFKEYFLDDVQRRTHATLNAIIAGRTDGPMKVAGPMPLTDAAGAPQLDGGAPDAASSDGGV